MATHHNDGASSSVGITWHRSRGEQQNYLLTIDISTKHSHENGGLFNAAYPQARAVVDDYGTLVIVRAWQ